MGRRSSAASGATTTYNYDSLDQLTKITSPADVPIHFGYDRSGRQAKITDGEGRAQRTHFDYAGRQTQLLDLGPNGVPLRRITFGYDGASNLAPMTNRLGRESDRLATTAVMTIPRAPPMNCVVPSAGAMANVLGGLERGCGKAGYRSPAIHPEPSLSGAPPGRMAAPTGWGPVSLIVAKARSPVGPSSRDPLRPRLLLAMIEAELAVLCIRLGKVRGHVADVDPGGCWRNRGSAATGVR